MYERGLEHLRDLNEMKAESHMLKHFFKHHEGEELSSMKFGARIVKAARTAFNRQVSESVQIQENAARNEIVNSKSEYNRCALPRLTTKLGEITVDKLEKMKHKKKKGVLNCGAEHYWGSSQYTIKGREENMPEALKVVHRGTP